ncbi:acyl-CoA/acyl-ACP dehydrogenase [Bacillus aquiflavi]|uniref:Acyl-CoA/acyl-ACP dehydrogenase n=1 Tax=Bacillus aquiflavi TaxID=2672567 RepID=A0A6B3VVD7_9BACI|nr:acyl-CoA dehydrogenase family protein [Bacillus aquiflavi]MBA4536585.1 acyl-CoA/acyl-ACP dehydrogenase [Bacillus aquiflavi]NEY80952.1 acyl-CoA/acyl-ACP dehydrogenase [Bacillus aquiflavi]UAC49666.1 acyl-CoA/acyl-ACP dehydrogenase [Bacillus aquiflavi]
MNSVVTEKNIFSRSYVEKIRTSIAPIIENMIKPNAKMIDKEGKFPRENLVALAKEGWNSVTLPEKWGGLDLGYLGFSIAAEEIGKVDASTALVYAMHIGATQVVNLYGNDDQKERWLLPIREGSIGTFSISEKATRGHVWFNLSQAERAEQDYIINAEKSFTTSGGQADFYILQTRTPETTDPSRVSYFIVDGHSKGISVKPWKALGVRGNHSGPISYRNVKVERRDLIGNEKLGNEIMDEGINPIYLVGLASAWLGVAQGALNAAVEHVTKAVNKGFNKNLADYQVIRQKLAEVKMQISALKAWQLDLARHHDELLAEGKSLSELAIEVIEFKVQTSELADFAARIAMDVAGGYGYQEGIFERLYRDARAGIPMAPSNNIARDQVGKDLVGLPLELWNEGNNGS